MPKTIQVRNVPDPVHAALKARAAKEGMSLSSYLRRELERAAQKATMREWLERTGWLEPIKPGPSAAEIVRRQRDSG